MEHRIFPAIFHKEENGGYWVEFPDLPGCFSQGETLEEAYVMSKEALALWLDDSEPKNPSELETIKVEGDDKVMLVEADNGDDIIYFKQSQVPKLIEEGLEKKGYTKYQVAQILGVDRGFITRITKGERTPSPDMAKRIGLLLDFDWRIFYADGSAV